jgi:hypothetical protein
VDAHEHDQNFPQGALERMNDFLDDRGIFESPEKHELAIEQITTEVSLLTTNSPYAEVRAVVDPYDDPNTPVATIRAWVIGIAFVVLTAFVNQLFSVRQPAISLGTAVVQLLAFPVGKAAERFLPDVGITLFGVRHSLNPGKFNKKEHMLISIMASVGKTLPSSRYISKHQLWEEKSLPGSQWQLISCSIHPMAASLLWPDVCKILWIPDLACRINQLDGIWSSWIMQTLSCLSILLSVACIPGHNRFK